jgi:hypothetical protein
VYGDFASGRIWALTVVAGSPATNALLLDSPQQISAFGVDRQDELYVVGYGTGRIYRLTGPATSVESQHMPVSFGLDQNFPNPFNPSTRIAFRIPESGRIRLSVHDLLGREAAVLVDGVTPAGNHEVRFDAGGLPSGVYVIRLASGALVDARRMLLLR